MHSGAITFLSRNHMKHHLVLYGPLQRQRSETYRDATDDSLSLGNIGLEWLVPAAMSIALVIGVFRLLHVALLYQLLSLGITLAWSFLMFSYLHDMMHIEGFWLAKNKWLKRWFLSARRLHDIHHRVLNDRGLMNTNFGIGFFEFDRLFGTLSLQQPPFNHRGYAAAREKFDYVE
jgi:sterol desaturase/sphingolipid hydroxylase (fatty acid hydroxylase superfamily)